VVRKLTDIGFKLSSLEEQKRLSNNKIDILLRKVDYQKLPFLKKR